MARKLNIRIFHREDGNFNMKYYWSSWDIQTNQEYNLTKEELQIKIASIIENTNWVKGSPKG